MKNFTNKRTESCEQGGQRPVAEERQNKSGSYGSGSKGGSGRETPSGSNRLTFYARLISQTLVRAEDQAHGQARASADRELRN